MGCLPPVTGLRWTSGAVADPNWTGWLPTSVTMRRPGISLETRLPCLLLGPSGPQAPSAPIPALGFARRGLAGPRAAPSHSHERIHRHDCPSSSDGPGRCLDRLGFHSGMCPVVRSTDLARTWSVSSDQNAEPDGNRSKRPGKATPKRCLSGRCPEPPPRAADLWIPLGFQGGAGHKPREEAARSARVSASRVLLLPHLLPRLELDAHDSRRAGQIVPAPRCFLGRKSGSRQGPLGAVVTVPNR